jgi:dGTP triphosphohydrolase
MLAGLGHDIGHGPFSHLFEDVIARNMGLQFDHEAMSQRLTRRMLDGIVTPAVADDVLAVMNGASAAKRAAFDGPRGVLRDMVSNKRCGVDVDSWTTSSATVSAATVSLPSTLATRGSSTPPAPCRCRPGSGRWGSTAR